MIVLAILLTLLWVKDTRPWADVEAKKHAAGASGVMPRYPKNISNEPLNLDVLTLMTWHDAVDGRESGGTGGEVR